MNTLKDNGMHPLEAAIEKYLIDITSDELILINALHDFREEQKRLAEVERQASIRRCQSNFLRWAQYPE